MANFKISENGLDITEFDIPMNRAVRLVQWGGDNKGNKLELSLNQSTPKFELVVLPDKLPAASTAFTIKGKEFEALTTVVAGIKGSGQSYSASLEITCNGVPTKQPGYAVDLLSELAISGNTTDIFHYSQIILGPSNNQHILSQDTRPGHFNCGDVAVSYGPKIFSKDVSPNTFPYYVLMGNKNGIVPMLDVKFDANRVKTGIGRIKALLDRGNPVRIWVLHHDASVAGGQIRGTPATHFLTVIGYSNNKFLYIDPWPHGSRLNYEGGMYRRTLIAFLGELTFDLMKPEDGIVSITGALGLHKYVVIGGPS